MLTKGRPIWRRSPTGFTAYAAWHRARQDMHDAWMFETDPRNLQPQAPKISRTIAMYLRDHPPRSIDQSRIEHSPDAIESRLSCRDEMTLRETLGRDYPSQTARAEAVVAEIERLRRERFEAPKPLPQVTLDQVHLACWMGVIGSRHEEIAH